MTSLSLLKSPFSLWQLMLRATMHTLLGDDAGLPVSPLDPANMGAFARRAPYRKLEPAGDGRRLALVSSRSRRNMAVPRRWRLT